MEQIKPGNFGKNVPADVRRMDFDFGNEQLLHMGRKIDFLFIGDSITQLWDLHLYFPTTKLLVNRGAGGDCSHYLRKRFDADCLQLKPKTVILMIGTNDVARCEEDPWWHTPGEEEEAVLAEYRENVKAMLAKCDEGGIAVVLCSVLPSTIAPPYNRERRWRMTAAMNSFLQEQGRTYVDYFSACTEDGKNIRPDYSLDGIHPNAVCYERMAGILQEAVTL